MALVTAHFLLSLYSKSLLFPVLEFLECSMCRHHKDVKTISGSKKVIEMVPRTSFSLTFIAYLFLPSLFP